MLIKFISEKQIKYFPGWIKEDGFVYTNKSAEEKALNYGYKELIVDETPEYNPETQYLKSYYVDEVDCVRKCWQIVENTAIEGDYYG